MSNKADKIPTLTQILQAGDPSMHHHFDAQKLQPDTHAEAIVENASEFENRKASSNSFHATRDESLDISTHMDQEDFSDAMQSLAPAINQPEDLSPDNKKALKKEIDEAIAEALPAAMARIEASLKQSLYKKFKL